MNVTHIRKASFPCFKEQKEAFPFGVIDRTQTCMVSQRTIGHSRGYESKKELCQKNDSIEKSGACERTGKTLIEPFRRAFADEMRTDCGQLSGMDLG